MRRQQKWADKFGKGSLQYKNFLLEDMETIAKYSFIVHKSVNYLDLSLRELSSLNEREMIFMRGMFCIANPVYTKKFVATAESCRKLLIGERRSLYTLHLDLPNGRENNLLSLKQYNGHCLRESKTLCFNDLMVKDGAYQFPFWDFFKEALKQNGSDLNFVRRQITLVKRMLRHWNTAQFSVADLILKYLYPTCTDTEIVNEFLSTIDFYTWVHQHSKPDVLKYLLIHAHRNRYDLRLNDYEGTLVIQCFYKSRFKYVELLMKYQNAPMYYDQGCEMLYRSWNRDGVHFVPLYMRHHPILRLSSRAVYSDWHPEDLEIPFKKGKMSSRRHLLLLQVFFCYPYRNDSVLNGPNATSTLRLLWRTLPDAFFTLDELMSAYQDVPGLIDTLTKVHAYYEKAVDGVCAISVPRSLQQYCRISIRKSLCYNLQLPYGIKKLNLPRKLQAFIRLQS